MRSVTRHWSMDMPCTAKKITINIVQEVLGDRRQVRACAAASGGAAAALSSNTHPAQKNDRGSVQQIMR